MNDEELKSRYAECIKELLTVGPLCLGTALCREGVRMRNGVAQRYGPYYQWSRKIRGKTVSVAVSRNQFEALQVAIGNQKKVDVILEEMRQITVKLVFSSIEGVNNRKPL